LARSLARTDKGDLDRTMQFLTTGMLVLIDALIRDPTHVRTQSIFHHLAGMTALLLSQKTSTELGVAQIYSVNGLITFIGPCYSGQISPFEGTHWQDAPPPQLMTTQGPDFDRLRLASHRLFILLPRLICLVRSLRQNAAPPPLIKLTYQLAENVLQMDDPLAETWLLHRVSIRPTVDNETKRLIPLSYAFDTPEEHAAGVHYWQTRLIVLRINIALHEIGAATDAQARLNSHLEEEVRMAKNILMSWEAALSFGPTGTAPMNLGMLAAWGALKRREAFNGFPPSVLGHWISKCLSRSVGGWIINDKVANLTTSSEVLSGGPLRGRGATWQPFGERIAPARSSCSSVTWSDMPALQEVGCNR
jgi:hypothetical protein